MKIATFTLTRERLDYTQRTFAEIKGTAGIEFDHFVLDNGSRDGTPEWLEKNKDLFKKVILSPDNKGLWGGINIILKETNFFEGYNYVLKLDNDVEFITDCWLRRLALMSAEMGNKVVLSPYVDGLGSGLGGAPRYSHELIAGNKISYSHHVGGICLFTSQDAYKASGYFPGCLGKAQGWDVFFCGRAKNMGYKIAYLEDVKIKHMDTTVEQEKIRPDYYNRKVLEARIPYRGNIDDYKIL